jgi:ubiquitin C-terminal hydrolase
MEEFGTDDLFSQLKKPICKKTHQLKSVICHQGTEKSGHYYSFCNNRGWKLFDDEKVTKAKEEEVLSG